MKAYYALPSGTYNIALSRDELVELVKTGRVNVSAYHIPCETGRAIYNSEKKILETLDRKEVSNRLMFRLNDKVADTESGDYGVQFLAIRLEETNDD